MFLSGVYAHHKTWSAELPVKEGRNDWQMYLAGENVCQPENVGGPHGYMDFLEVMHNPRREHSRPTTGAAEMGPSTHKPLSPMPPNLAIHKLRVSHGHVKTDSQD